MILVPVTYKGGVYRHSDVMDLIEDIGGYIVQKHVIAQEVVLQCFVPQADVEFLRNAVKPVSGEVTDSPLVGTEIAVVSMSLEIHHLPHMSCDVAEYLRRSGAKSNMVSLARGPGKRIAQLNDEERDVINEHDIAIYLLGNFEKCIQHKMPNLRRGIAVPIVLCGGPDEEVLRLYPRIRQKNAEECEAVIVFALLTVRADEMESQLAHVRLRGGLPEMSMRDPRRNPLVVVAIERPKGIDERPVRPRKLQPQRVQIFPR